MLFQGVRGMNKTLKKKSILLYHGPKRSFCFQIKSNKAICIHCQHIHNNHDRSFFNTPYKIDEDDIFETNPGRPSKHICDAKTREEIEAKQIYRKVLREVCGKKVTGPYAYKWLAKRFKRLYGHRYREFLEYLPSKEEVQKSLRKRARDGIIFDDNSDKEDDIELTDDESKGRRETSENDEENESDELRNGKYSLRKRKNPPRS